MTACLGVMTEITMIYLTASNTDPEPFRFHSIICCSNVLVRVGVV